MISKLIKKAVRIGLFSLSLMLMSSQLSYGTPQNNYFDPQPIHTVFGTDKYYNTKNKQRVGFRFHLSPIYQQTSTARNNDGKKVPAGDRLGHRSRDEGPVGAKYGAWNMDAIFFGVDGAPTTINFANPAATNPAYQNFITAQQNVTKITSQPQTVPPVPTPANDYSRYRGGIVSSNNQLNMPVRSLTTETNFDPNKDTFFYITAPADYEKIGLRSQLNIDTCWGFGFSVKGGIVDVKQKLEDDFKFERQFDIDRGAIVVDSSVTQEQPGGPDAQKDATLLFCDFMSSAIRNKIAKEFNLNINRFHRTDAEDIHVEGYWNIPIDLEDPRGDLALTFIPRFAVGAWLPTSREANQDNAFSVITGNNKHTGLTVDFSLGFDLPLLPKDEQSLQFNFGGGFVLYNQREFDNQRFYTSPYQGGMVPWKVSKLTRRPGLVWYANASLKAEEILENLSVYFDWLYTVHLRDKITLQEDNPVRLAAFQKGLNKAKYESAWKDQQVNGGLNYRLGEVVSIGGAFQAHISGVRVYRCVTLLGSISVIF